MSHDYSHYYHYCYGWCYRSSTTIIVPTTTTKTIISLTTNIATTRLGELTGCGDPEQLRVISQRDFVPLDTELVLVEHLRVKPPRGHVLAPRRLLKQDNATRMPRRRLNDQDRTRDKAQGDSVQSNAQDGACAQDHEQDSKEDND